MSSGPRYVKRAILRKVVESVATLAIILIALFPIYWGFITSIKPTNQIMKQPPELIPTNPTLVHYVRLIEAGILQATSTSLLITAATVLLTVAMGALGGYALARWTFTGKTLVLAVVVAVMSVPIASLLVPTFTLMAEIGLLDTRVGLVLLYTAYQLPMVLWLLYGFFLTLPQGLEHAAMVDGYSRTQVLWKIVLPLSKPALTAAALFVTVFAWNDFVVAVTMTSSESARTLPMAIYTFLGYFGREWGPLLAASMLSLVPIVAVFVFSQRYFLSGLTGGAVKG